MMEADTFSYCCPQCRTTNIIHKEQCRWSDVHVTEFERRYIDIISALVIRKSQREAMDGESELPMDREWLRDEVSETMGVWDSKHDACLEQLIDASRVVEEDGMLMVLTPEERKDRVTPAGSSKAIQLVYENGACDGCLDYGTSAIVSWCEMEGFGWERTREFTLEWLDETGTWERGDFEEPTPEALVANKRHIHEKGVGWAKFANQTVKRLADEGLIAEDEIP